MVAPFYYLFNLYLGSLHLTNMFLQNLMSMDLKEMICADLAEFASRASDIDFRPDSDTIAIGKVKYQISMVSNSFALLAPDRPPLLKMTIDEEQFGPGGSGKRQRINEQILRGRIISILLSRSSARKSDFRKQATDDRLTGTDQSNG